jgi:proteasome accessory factor A
MSEVATYLKVGTTAILLAMIEDNELGDEWLLGNPVSNPPSESRPDVARTIMLRDGRRATALEVQWGLLERARKYEQTHGLQPVGEAVGADVLARWEHVLGGLERDPASMANWVDWVAKRRLLNGYAERHSLQPGAARLRAIDLQYHDLRRERCLRSGRARHARRPWRRHRRDGRAAAYDAAYFRGKCLQSSQLRWSPPIGTRSYSTSAAIRCAECR